MVQIMCSWLKSWTFLNFWKQKSGILWIQPKFDVHCSLPFTFSCLGMFYAASSSVLTWRWSQSLETCRVRWPASPSTTRTSTWTAGESHLFDLIKLTQHEKKNIVSLNVSVFTPPLRPVWHIWMLHSEVAMLCWRTAQTWAMWRMALPAVPTWCAWSDAASLWRHSTSAPVRGPTLDASVPIMG